MTGLVKEFLLPDLGEGLTEAEIVRWLVGVGDSVTVDQPVVEVETAKAVVEVPCPYAGVVTRLWGREGTILDVGQPLLAIGEEPAPSVEVSDPSGSAEGSGSVLVGYGTSTPAARRRRVLVPTPGSTVTVPAAVEVARAGSVRVISPLVRRLAKEHCLDLGTVRGSGPGGLILRKDVEQNNQVPYAHAAPAPNAPALSGESAARTPEAVLIPLRGARRTIADKLARSRQEIPDATTWVDVDATRLLDTKQQLTIRDDAKVSLLALLARICLAGLARHPELNATLDTSRQEIIQLPSVHLGFAAQTERGLVVPVIRNAQRMKLPELSAEIARLTARARAGELAPADLSGGTFTLNNYGVFGVDGSTPIINHPEAGMLGFGRILPRPWVVDGELAIRHLCQLSLTFDHRVCDGGAAGGFLRHVADLIEQPASLLRLL
ncbi:dihydrolipoamide acetyltransferase family protein [Streptomyces sp. LHD-70]|uniref:dihydrolipoamide acetyltransferase family protein n=1 Tax=Streptomyces sp. LHD-70 TaxID=3072140 RepID=UPI00280D2F74|nr:dihydrolipoamide acetyltransferase family protein [Streptomyces sp. LHD-70]MDQ8708127.1 dihydrolipoamide acetyltransferase family protein [Streptomyces sp. LHD-70]